jgi:hypothetical protein
VGRLSVAKKIRVKDDKKGWVEIGTLSKNELCRGIQQLMTEGQRRGIQFEQVAIQYGNLLASLDACEVVYK